MVERIWLPASCLTRVSLDLYLFEGDRGSQPVGTMGGSLPGRSGRDQSAQIPAPPQGADGRADPRTATALSVLVRTVDARRKNAAGRLQAAAIPFPANRSPSQAKR